MPKKRTSSQLTEAEYYIMLSLKEPLHGYAIMQSVKKLSESTLNIGPATLYTVLQRLSEGGLIENATPAKNEDPRRKIYALTERGKAVLVNDVWRRCAMAEHGVQILTEIGIM